VVRRRDESGSSLRSGPRFRPPRLAALVNGGDVVACAVVQETAGYVGAALVDLVNLSNPRRIVIGG